MENITELLAMAASYEPELPPAKLPLTPPPGKEIAGCIDHTLLKPEATAEQVKQLCAEAQEYHFASVCINPVYVPLAAGLLSRSPVLVCTVIGFPLGATTTTQKMIETVESIHSGAKEIDMVMNIGALKGEAYGQVLNDIETLAQVAHNQRAILKVILETGLLTRQEKIIACLLSKAGGADFVKTSTGFGPGGATAEDVELMYRVVGPSVQVKASGGIRTLADAQAMICAGAARLGTSSGVRIVKEALP